MLAGGIDVAKYLLEFLTPREQRSLLDTTPQLADIKKHLLFWRLTKHQSRIFYEHPSFRSQLETLVHDPSQQLSLRFEGGLGITEVGVLGGVHTLILFNCDGITDVSALGSVSSLTLWDCHNFADVSALGSVYSLSLADCPGITDVSDLGSVHTLSLADCPGITDVSALGNVCTLDLSGCHGITNVKRLGWCAYLEFV
jgi:hypothetical protein